MTGNNGKSALDPLTLTALNLTVIADVYGQQNLVIFRLRIIL